MKEVKILNCLFSDCSMNEFLNTFKSGVVAPTNVDVLAKLQYDKDFYRVMNSFEFVVNDSRILSFASRYLLRKPVHTIAGSDIFPAFYNFHKTNSDIRIFLLGAGPKVAEKAKFIINEKVGRKIIVGDYSPPFGFEAVEEETRKIIDLIQKSDATVLAVGLGAPKQEKWIGAHRKDLPKIKMFLCVGATIDFEAGAINRAPKWVRYVGFEWAYRLLKEPGRLWKRYLIDDLPLLWLLLRQAFGMYRNPFEEILN